MRAMCTEERTTAAAPAATQNLFDVMNRAAHGATLSAPDTGRLIKLLGRDCPATQTQRELVHNGLQALRAVGGGDLYVTGVDVDGVTKYAVTDTGSGMNVEQLNTHLLNLNVSGGGVDDSRFGMGARITGLTHSPHGVEYVTWDGTNDPVRGRLVRTTAGDICWELDANGNSFQKVPVSHLPREIRRAGHGTRVILHGQHRNHDTFKDLEDSGAHPKNKAHLYFVNTRYTTLPDNVNVHVEAYRGDGKRELRTNDVVGLVEPLRNPTPVYHGVVALTGADICVYVTDKTAKSGWRNGDNTALGSFVGVVLPDAEMPEVEEIYDRFESQAGYRKLQAFGLGPISKQTVLLVYPHNATATVQRTNLRIGSRDLPWDTWESEFRDAMPAELADLVDNELVSSARTSKAVANLTSRLQALSNLLDPTVFGTVPTPVPRPAPRKRNNSNGGNGNGNGGNGPTNPPPPSKPTTVPAGVPVPHAVDVDAAHMAQYGQPDMAGYFEPHTKPHGVLYVNNDFRGVEFAVNAHLQKYPKVSAAQRNAVRALLLDHMTARMLEVVVSSKAFCDAASPPADTYDQMTSPEALTSAALIVFTTWSSAQQSVTQIMSASKR